MKRFTFHFENDTQGWSELLYRAADFGSGEGGQLENYIINRLALMSTTCRLVSIRSSDTDTKRDVTIIPVPLGGRKGTWSHPDNPDTFTEDTFTALSLRLSDGNQNYRNFPMLAIPDHIFVGNQVAPAEVVVLNSRLNPWMASLTAAGFGMKKQDAPVISGRIVEFPDKTEANQLVCLGLVGTIPPVGSHVTLGSVKPFNKLNRTWRVSETDGPIGAVNGYIYLAGTAYLNTFGAVEGGTYKVPVYSLSVLNQFTISRLTSRKTGVPFTTVRGRR